MSEIILSLKNLGKSFGKDIALRNVNMEVKKGDIYGLIGRNGAGKTTIMKLITDMSTETTGEIVLLGVNKQSKEYNDRLQRIGFVVEAPVAYHNLSAYENMKIICIQKGIHDLSIIEESLAFVNLLDIKKKKFKNFSLGMKQRLGIAMALVGNPDFLILDEPLNGLDPIAIIEFRELIARVNREKNTTVLISSHILTELYQVSTRFGFLHDGQLVQELTKLEFDALNTERIVVKVDDINKAAILLREKVRAQFEVVQQDEIHIVARNHSVSEINRLFVLNGILVDFIGRKENNLENYFLNLVDDSREKS